MTPERRAAARATFLKYIPDAAEFIAAHQDLGVTEDTIDKEVCRVADILNLAEEVVRPLQQTIEALTKRVAELEGKALTDGGIYRSELSYRPREVVTSGGQLWIARTNVASGQKPGTVIGDEPPWRMLTKSYRPMPAKEAA
jgi:hypothetical protein